MLNSNDLWFKCGFWPESFSLEFEFYFYFSKAAETHRHLGCCLVCVGYVGFGFDKLFCLAGKVPFGLRSDLAPASKLARAPEFYEIAHLCRAGIAP